MVKTADNGIIIDCSNFGKIRKAGKNMSYNT